MLLQLQMEIKCSPKVRILQRHNSQTLWSLAKRHLKQGGQIVCLIFYTEILATLIEYFSDVIFAYKLQCKRNSTSLITIVQLNSIRFIASLLYGLKIVTSENSVFEVRILDVAVLCENTDLKHFVFGDTTGPAKVSRVHCRSRPSLPVFVP